MTAALSITVKFEQLRNFVPLLKQHRIGAEVNLADAYQIFKRDPKEAAELGRLLSANGIPVTAHLPFMDLNMGSLDPQVREYSSKALHWGMDIGLALGASLFVTHTGFWPLIPRKDYKQWLENYSAGLEPLVQRAISAGATLAVENTWEPDDEMPSAIFTRITNPAVGFCLDVGHANCFSKLCPIEWLKRLGARLSHVHLHDNNGENDDHGALGTGSVPILEFFEKLAALKLTPSINLEANPDDVEHNLRYLEKLSFFSGR